MPGGAQSCLRVGLTRPGLHAAAVVHPMKANMGDDEDP